MPPAPQSGETHSHFIATPEDAENGLKITPSRTVKTTAAPPPSGDPLEYVMSDASVDRMGDVIEPGGWELANFRRNPVALFGHNANYPIGTWRDVTIDGDQLRGRLELMPPVSDRLRELHAAVAAGVLRSVSVGFRPIEFAELEGSKIGGLHFTKSELLECSLVSVPANPNALAVAKELRLSRDTQRLIFGGLADDGQTARNRGFTGGLAEDPRKRKPAMTPRERIEQAEATINALRDQLNDHLATLGDDPGEDALATQDQLRDKINVELRKLQSFQAAEVALGVTSEPAVRQVPASSVTVIPPQRTPSAVPRPFAMPRKASRPGELLMNAIIADVGAHVTRKPMEAILAERGWSEDVGTRSCLEWVRRAATAPATSATTGWAAELVQTQYAEFISALLIDSIYEPLSAIGARYTLGRYGQISIPVEQTTPTIAGSFVRSESVV
jgi:HK97 family phage prohead protease